MNPTTLDNALWITSILCDALLLIVIFWRGRWRLFPCFCGWAVFRVLNSACLFLALRFGSRDLYAWMYWLFAFVDIGLQVVVVFELANHVFRSNDGAAKTSRRLTRGVSIAATIVAFALACGVHPSAPRSLDAWEVRGNLFTSLLICELFTIVVLISQKFGFGWRSHAIGIGTGLTLWAILSLVVDTLHGYWGAVLHFNLLEHVKILGFLAAQFIWIVALWRDEPKKKPIPPEMRDAILQVTDRVSYDLAKALGTRGKEFR